MKSSSDDGLASEIERLRRRLGRERRARLEAEAISERATRQLYQREKQVELLQVIAVASNEAASIEAALQIALDRVCAYTGWPVGHAFVLADDGKLESTRLWHLDQAEGFETFRYVTEAARFPSGIGLPGRVLESGRPAWIIDVRHDSNFPRAKVATRVGVRGAFGFPVRVGDSVVGVVEFFAAEPREPDPSLLELMNHVGTQLGRVIERMRGRRDLEGARDAALESSRLKSAFLANMSHEIRTPLNVILGYTSLVGEHLAERGDDSQKMLITGVESAGTRLLETVTGILDLSKIESGTFELNPEDLEIARLVREIIEDFRDAARKKGLALVCEADDTPTTVHFDRRCLTGALTNLLSNAVKFTDQGTIRVKLDRDGAGHLYLEVRDTGIGIDAAFLPRLCEPFTQEDPGAARAFEGSGLGLSLVKRYVEMNGARLWVESRKGEGSAFRVEFSSEA